MAMIQCSECKRDISDQALACPGCGAPGAKGAPSAPQQKVESTRGGAKYEIAGFLMIIAGMLMAIGSDGMVGSIGGAMMAVGFCVFLVGRFN